MNATAFTVPGEGAMVIELYRCVQTARLPLRLRGEVCHDLMLGYDLSARTNLVLLSNRPDGLTDADLDRIRKVQVTP